MDVVNLFLGSLLLICLIGYFIWGFWNFGNSQIERLIIRPVWAVLVAGMIFGLVQLYGLS